MSALKLIALDAEDLTILSTHLQDAATTVGDLAWQPRERRFVALLNRFDWSDAVRAGGQPVRRQAALRIERVTAAQVQKIDPRSPKDVLALLAVRFEPGVDPSGALTLVFADGRAVRLTVECIEVQLEDLGPVWAARGVPKHEV
jgi:hypothetical protein